MTLQGQGAGTLRQTDGFAMAALLVGMAVMAVLMAVAMPVWRSMTTREREAELVFRGEQWARGIALFQRKYPGAFPPTLDVLVQQKFVRRDYKDPITRGDFQPLYMAQAAGGRGPAGGGPGSQGARPGTVGSALGGVQPGGQGQPQGTDLSQQVSPGGIRSAIIGVVSKSPDESMMVYKGHNHYNEWQFVFSQVSGMPGGQGVPQGQPQPGMGRPGQGPGMGFPGGMQGPGGRRQGPGGVRRPGQGPGGPGTFQPRRPGGGPGGR